MSALVATLRSLGACAESLRYVAAHGDDAVSALVECPDRRWLTWLAGALMACGHLDRRVIVLCACASARTALRYVPAGEERPLRAIETAEAWCRGEATIEDVRTAQRGARAARDDAWARWRTTAADADAAAAAAAAARAAVADDVDAAAAAAAATATATTAAAAADDDDDDDAWRAARARAEAEQLALTKWMLGPALLDGLRAYAATIGGCVVSPAAETLPAPPRRTSDERCAVRGCGDHADMRPAETRIHGVTRQVIRAGAPLCATCYLHTTPACGGVS